jgi:hypothetical protein
MLIFVALMDLLEELITLWLLKKIPALYGTQSFITVYTKVCHQLLV